MTDSRNSTPTHNSCIIADMTPPLSQSSAQEAIAAVDIDTIAPASHFWTGIPASNISDLELSEALLAFHLPLPHVESAIFNRDWTYGNTQALQHQKIVTIDDSSRDTERHYTFWIFQTEEEEKSITQYLQRDDYTATSPATCATAEETWPEYIGYPTLFRERKGAANYPSNSKPSEIGLFDLPGEIRNKIYRYVLVVGQPIEMLPPRQLWRFYARGVYADNDDIFSANHQYYFIQKDILPAMRVCRQACTEMREIFYGENVFRFSDFTGWEVFSGFLATIGPKNSSLLRDVTVPFPCDGMVCWMTLDYPDGEMGSVKCDGWSKNLDIYARYNREVPSSKWTSRWAEAPTTFHFPREPKNHAATIKYCMDSLTAVEELVNLTFFLPFQLDIHNIISVNDQLARIATRRLSVQLLELQDVPRQRRLLSLPTRPLRQTTDDLLRFDGGQQVRVRTATQWTGGRAYARDQGWGYRIGAYDFKGRQDTDPSFECNPSELYVDRNEAADNATAPSVPEIVSWTALRMAVPCFQPAIIP